MGHAVPKALQRFLTGFSTPPPLRAFFFLDVDCFRPVSFRLYVFFCLCLSGFLSLQLFPLFSIPILPFLLICCVYMRLNSLRPKRWFCSHLRCQILPSFRDLLFLQTLPTISHTLYELFPFNFSRRHVWCLHRQSEPHCWCSAFLLRILGTAGIFGTSCTLDSNAVRRAKGPMAPNIHI